VLVKNDIMSDFSADLIKSVDYSCGYILNMEEFAHRIEKEGYCLLDIKDDPLMGQLRQWESIFALSFAQQDKDKLRSGKYRVRNGQAVGYRRDELREFFETRFHRKDWSRCDPSYPGVEGYDECVQKMARFLAGVGNACLVAISKHLGLDETFLRNLTDATPLDSSTMTETETHRKRNDNINEGGDDDNNNNNNDDDDDDDNVSSALLRICSYPKGEHNASTDPDNTRVAFGSHTDTSFITVSPCSSVSGLEIQDRTTKEDKKEVFSVLAAAA